MRYSLAIFDFDGTLADSFPFFLSVFNTLADRHGFDRIDTRLEHVARFRHYSVRRMMDHVGMPAWKLPSVSRSFIGMMRERAAEVPLFDGIPDALRHLAAHGVRLAVVSSNAEHNVRAVLGPELAALIKRYECGMSIFGKASRLRGVLRDAEVARPGAMDSAIYIGDQATDRDAARAAGVAFGGVHWGYSSIEALRSEGCTHEFVVPRDLQKIAHPK